MQAYVARFPVYFIAIIEFCIDYPTKGRISLGIEMIGVILWSDPVDQKAVIWCEDQGDLAYLSKPGPIAEHRSFVEVGDVVEFDLSFRRTTHRVAENIRLVSQAVAADLVRNMRAAPMSSRQSTATRTAEIVPLRPRQAVNAKSEHNPISRQG